VPVEGLRVPATIPDREVKLVYREMLIPGRTELGRWPLCSGMRRSSCPRETERGRHWHIRRSPPGVDLKNGQSRPASPTPYGCVQYRSMKARPRSLSFEVCRWWHR